MQITTYGITKNDITFALLPTIIFNYSNKSAIGFTFLFWSIIIEFD